MSLTSDLLGIPISNPLVVASGPLTDQEKSIRRMINIGAGAVVTKTIHPHPPHGLNERVVRIATGMLNSTTYSQRSVTDWCSTLKSLAADQLPVVVSIHADSPPKLGDLAARVEQTGCRALELGISCINEGEELEDTPQRVFAFAKAVRDVTALPFSVKLALGESLPQRARAAVEAGANALTISDTIPGLSVDVETGKLHLGGVFGYSGPGIKPLVQGAIHQLRQQGITVEISATGGASSPADIAEYLSIGARSVQVYTVLHNNTFKTLERLLADLHTYFEQLDMTPEDMLRRSLT